MVIVLALIVVLVFFWHDAKSDKYDITISEDAIPVFSPISLPFIHQHNGKKSLPIAPSALIDIDNDGVDELFLGGGLDQSDALFAFRNGAYINISKEVGLNDKGDFTSSGAASADFDINGFTDLVVGREDGLHIYYNENGKFTHKAIVTPLNEKSNPAGITVGDVDEDGDLDIFLSTYLKKELMEGQTKFEDYTYGSTSALLLNDGNDVFRNVTTEAGLDYVHNTFMAILVDIDDDGDLDLIVAHDTGEVRTYSNNGQGKYKKENNPLTGKFAYPMGIAAGDYNNDGRVDFMFSNTGSTLPRMLAKGDITDASLFNEKWIFWRNDGDFKFTDVAEETKVADYEFSWGAVLADMNNDGLQDLMVAENYVDLAPNKLFRLPSRMLMQKEDQTFVPTEQKSGVVNPYFGITPLVTDLDQNGSLDFIWVNIDSPALAYLNTIKSGHFLKVTLPKTAKSIGAKVQVTTDKGTYTDWLMTGEGLASDLSGTLHFGLGTATQVLTVKVTYLNGQSRKLTDIKLDSSVRLEDPVLE
jgi:hypothetical protein